MRHHVLVRLDPVQKTGLLEDLDDDLAGLETVLALQLVPGAVESGRIVQPFQKLLILLDGDLAIDGEDVDLAQALALADLEVVEIMGRRHLDGAGAGGRVRIFVGNDRDLATDDRQDDVLADDRLVALVFG